VKGGRNEDILADLLSQNIHPRRTLTNVELVDTHGERSHEVDIAVCNHWQPFVTRDSRLLIVEGVDVVVQVKARLDGNELRRAFHNASTVKGLRRHLPDKVTISNVAGVGDADRLGTRVPYVLFAFESIGSDALEKRIGVLTEDARPEDLPDAIVVLDSLALFNMGDGETFVRSTSNAEVDLIADKWLSVDARQAALGMLLWLMFAGVPNLSYPKHPVLQYPFWDRTPPEDE